MLESKTELPLILAGPIVRHVAHDTFTLWLASSEDIKVNVALYPNNCESPLCSYEQNGAKQVSTPVGEHCFIHSIVLKQNDLFENGNIYEFDVQVANNTNTHLLSELLPNLLYEGQTRFSFKFATKLSQVIHGSCRKAHFTADDALPQLDALIAKSINTPASAQRPDLVLFTGDQVYVDDVAGPMLCAIKQIIKRLGLFHESFEDSTVKSSEDLFDHPDSYYKREHLLPDTEANEDLTEAFFRGKRKPVFTSVNAKNHLIALNEMIALYLLSWSSRLWPFVDTNKAKVDDEFQETYQQEQKSIANFAKGLAQVERAMAHIPIYMIFDDHDVTDDWNLTRSWEEHVYENSFSRRIVGNALIAYLLCQGLGNPEHTWTPLLDNLEQTFSPSGINKHDEFINTVLKFHAWQYSLDTSPPIQVLDTRTQRWQSETNAKKPSGLMTWESLCELQHELIGKESVIMVSAAPVYGVKFIEAIQRIFITFGGALMVDAENWMAHRGTARVMLNIFTHTKTPPHFIILSGDVHYSFVYDVSLRFRKNSPKITQFTCSGIHNQFPDKLLSWFERFNRWFYSHRSPLNALTKRRNMSIKERENDVDHKDVYNGTSLGLLELDENGHEKACKLVLANGDVVTFIK
ncbi:alkaline phosphatase family protein [Glaciecola sp. 2405UD65-10]|uniref:alkaline phosphatase family protein n=1 Tax=Glaciecola sp. 2405UD65-10 TaxID=3397244 RepID=UPI003B58C4E2